MNGKWKSRSSRSEVFLGNAVPKSCSKYAGENACRSEKFIKAPKEVVYVFHNLKGHNGYF